MPFKVEVIVDVGMHSGTALYLTALNLYYVDRAVGPLYIDRLDGLQPTFDNTRHFDGDLVTFYSPNVTTISALASCSRSIA